MRFRRNAVCVGLLLIPVIIYLTGILSFNLQTKIVKSFEAPKVAKAEWKQIDQGWVDSVPILRRDVKSTKDENIPGKKSGETKRYHVLINSYMNSGSRFTAGMFGFRSDSFYFYEPLWRLGLWDYFHRPNLVCSSILYKEKCAKKTAEEVNIYRERGRIYKGVSNATMYKTPIEMMNDILAKIYNCQLVGLSNLVVKGVQDDYGGPGWKEYKLCSRGKTPKHKCLEALEKKCKAAKHVVTKVLRLTTESLEELLLKNENIKVIHLFRDPRAIVNSRLESRGYATKDANSNARTLCQKMTLDYEGGLRLMKKFPGRLRFAFYDDIKNDVKGKIQKLFDFVGMTFNLSEFQQINQVKTNDANNRSPQMKKSRASDNTKWWRTYMPYTKYKTVEDLCQNVVEKFNLTRFPSREDLIDTKIPSMNLPDVLTV